jgi:hypothetical protein
MNKYLKHYIRNRDIMIKRHKDPMGYELDYLDLNNIGAYNIGGMISKSGPPEYYIENLFNDERIFDRLKKSIHIVLYSLWKEHNAIELALNNSNVIPLINPSTVKELIKYSKVRDGYFEFIKMIFEHEVLYSNIDNNVIEVLLKPRSKMYMDYSDQIYELILNNEMVSSKMDEGNVFDMLTQSAGPKKLVDRYGDILIEKIKKFAPYSVSILLRINNNEEEIRYLLDKYNTIPSHLL